MVVAYFILFIYFFFFFFFFEGGGGGVDRKDSSKCWGGKGENTGQSELESVRILLELHSEWRDRWRSGRIEYYQ